MGQFATVFFVAIGWLPLTHCELDSPYILHEMVQKGKYRSVESLLATRTTNVNDIDDCAFRRGLRRYRCLAEGLANTVDAVCRSWLHTPSLRDR